MSEERIAEFQIAVNEVATNTIVHTDGPGTLRIWRDFDAFVVEISDDGRITDPLAGRRRVGADQTAGRGLLLAAVMRSTPDRSSTSHGTRSGFTRPTPDASVRAWWADYGPRHANDSAGGGDIVSASGALSALRSDPAALIGRRDLDPTRLGLFRHGNTDGEDAGVVVGLQLVGVEGVPQE